MKFFRVAAALVFLTASARADGEPALPVWDAKERAEEKASGRVPGTILLTDDPLPDEPAKAAAEPLGLELPTSEETAGDTTLFPQVPEKFLSDYFAERPKSFLIDPQGLLAPSDYRDRLGFLNYHASDSSIDLFVFVLEADQEIPSEVRVEEMIERCFSEGRPAATIYYYLGAPQRSVIYLSPSLIGSISAAEQHRALESSIMQAIEKTNPSEQFEKFLVQMSIRIYWMERMLSGTVDLHTDPVQASAGHLAAAPVRSGKLIWAEQIARNFAVPLPLIAGILLTAFGFHRWMRLRARYRFPELEVEPRLGGAHAAGIGAVISFASAAVPPASQRDQVPEYLRRM